MESCRSVFTVNIDINIYDDPHGPLCLTDGPMRNIVNPNTQSSLCSEVHIWIFCTCLSHPPMLCSWLPSLCRGGPGRATSTSVIRMGPAVASHKGEGLEGEVQSLSEAEQQLQELLHKQLDVTKEGFERCVARDKLSTFACYALHRHASTCCIVE